MAEVSQEGGGGKPKSGKGKPKQKKASTKIDMTPMVDLAFLLLTFFMLTTTFSKPKTMQVIMPDKPKEDTETPKINEKDVMNLILAEENKLYYYFGLKDPQVEVASYSPSSKRSIRRILVEEQRKNIRRNGQDKFMVLIKPSDKSNYKNLVDIFDEMNINAVQRYALVDITPDEEKLIKEQQDKANENKQ